MISVISTVLKILKNIGVSESRMKIAPFIMQHPAPVI